MPSTIFNGDAIKLLKEKLRFKSGTEIITNDSDDPTSVAKDAPQGSIYIQSGTGKVFIKQDAGSTTNWKETSYVVSVTANRALVSDANGDITSSSVTDTELGHVSGVTSAIQTQLDSKLNLSGGTLTGTLTLNADGSGSLDAVTKQQLDAALDGVQRKQSVVVATTANITLSGEQTIDGVLTSASRVLVKDQTSQDENGIYLSGAGAWTRTSDANTSAELNHAITSVESGTANSDTAWEQTTDNPNVGVDNIVWAKAYGAGTYTADGQGIELSGSTFSLEIDGSTLSKSASGVKVADLGVDTGQLATSAVTDAKVATGVDAAKLADGSVSNTEFQYINSLTSNAQTQIDGKVDGPGSATNNAIAKYDGTTGKLVQNSGVTIDASNNVSGVNDLNTSTLDIGSTTQVSSIVDEDDLGSDSATALATQQSIKSYVDSKDVVNYVSNNEFIVDTTGWATYADAAGTSPVDGTGGSPTTTFTRTTSSPLRGVASGLITKDAANRQGEGVSFDFTIDSQDLGKTLFVSFDVETSANYVADDILPFIYDRDGTALVTLNRSGNSTRFTGTFTADATNDDYRLILHIATTNALAYTMKIDNVKVGPAEIVDTVLTSGENLSASAFVTGTGNGGATLTANTTNIDFTEAKDQLDLWDGSVFTAPKTATYRVTGCISATANTAVSFYGYVNGSVGPTVGNFPTATTIFQFNGTFDLTAGDTLSIRTDTGFTLDNSDDHYILIEQLRDQTVWGVYGPTELVEDSVSTLTNYSFSGAQWVDVTSFSLTEGEWDIAVSLGYYNNGVTSNQAVGMGVNTTSGNSSAGLNNAENKIDVYMTSTSGAWVYATIPRYRVTLANTTTHYLKSFVGTTTNVQYVYYVSARRIK